MKAGSLITIVLLVACGLLAGVVALFASGWSGEANPLPPTTARPLPASDLDQLTPFSLGDVDDYVAIGERPLFRADRRPKPPEVIEDPGTTNDPVETPELDVAIGGIIITADAKIALLTDRKTKEHMRVKEGANLDGELADWVLASVEPRKLSFDGGSAGTVELELEVSNKAMAAPARPAAAKPKPVSTTAEVTAAEADPDRAARAEEIRRKVAERREQLREEAARRRANRLEGSKIDTEN